MPWYKFYASHGPGHQSETIFYRWYDEVLNKDLRDEFWQDAFRENEWPIGGVRLCAKLPEKVHREEIDRHNRRIKSAQYMLKVLARTKTCKPHPTKRELASRRLQRMLDKREREMLAKAKEDGR